MLDCNVFMYRSAGDPNSPHVIHLGESGAFAIAERDSEKLLIHIATRILRCQHCDVNFDHRDEACKRDSDGVHRWVLGKSKFGMGGK